MAIRVLIPGPLRPLTGGAGEVDVEAADLGAAIQALEARHPGVGARLLDDGGRLRSYVRVFVNDKDVRSLQDAATPLAAGDTVAIVPAIAGGAPAPVVLIDARGPYETVEAESYYGLAADLLGAGNAVTLFLVQNGVLAARRSRRSAVLSELAGRGVRILADDFSLRERGITPGRLLPEVEPAPLSVVVDHLEQGHKVLWN